MIKIFYCEWDSMSDKQVVRTEEDYRRRPEHVWKLGLDYSTEPPTFIPESEVSWPPISAFRLFDIKEIIFNGRLIAITEKSFVDIL